MAVTKRMQKRLGKGWREVVKVSRYCECIEPKTRNIASNRCLKCGKIVKKQESNDD